MRIHVNTENGGFCLGSNFINFEKLCAGAVTAILIVISKLIGKKSNTGNRNRKSKKHKGSIILKLIGIPTLYKLIKSVFYQLKLSGIVSKAKSGIYSGCDQTVPKPTEEYSEIEVIDSTLLSKHEQEMICKEISDY